MGHDQELFWGIWRLKNLWEKSETVRPGTAHPAFGLERPCEMLGRYHHVPLPTKSDDDDQ